jgi:hypothetical protein
MAICFVIQPFDKGPYDKRYEDILKPAITDAGLEPYRVDQDPSVTIPIEDIENHIREAEICLADISTNNPNVWYEVGFAFANGKPVVLICAEPRAEAFPFHVRHRHIISYATQSSSDFDKLKKEGSDYKAEGPSEEGREAANSYRNGADLNRLKDYCRTKSQCS